MSSALALFGWVIDSRALRSFGVDDFPIWPLTALGFTLLSLGFLASIFDKSRIACALWLAPLLIASLAIVEYIGGDLGVDRLLFPTEISSYPGAYPGRPGANACTILMLLSIAGYGSRIRGLRSATANSIVSASMLAIAGVVAALTLAAKPWVSTTQIFTISLPAAVTAMALALAFLIVHGKFRWMRSVTAPNSGWGALWILLPAALLLAVLPSMLKLLVADRKLIGPAAAEAIVALGNIALVAIVAFWASIRVAREQAAMDQLRQILDYTTIALAREDGSITFWSEGCERLYGWTAEEAVGQNKYGLLQSRCAADGDTSADQDGHELIETCRDGHEVSVLERATRIESPGRPPLILFKVTDITKRLAAIEALKTSEERLAVATSAHELGIFEWDVRSGRLDWSPGTEHRLGLAVGTISDFEGWSAQIEPDDLRLVLDTIERATRDRADKFSFRYRFLRERAGVRTVEGSARAFYDADGNLSRTVGVILDVTEREEREAALRRREAQLRSILETVPDAMIVIDEEGTILQFSAAAEALWGYKAADVLGRSATLLVPADSRDYYLARLKHFLETREGQISEIITGTAESADGRRFPIELRRGAARSDGQVLVTIFVRDLTHQLATEERLSELSSEIAHVSRQSAMSELAADLAHELNQPLAATSNFLAAARMLIEKGDSGERVTDLLRMGSEQTQRAGEIIRRMRAFMARGEVEMRAELVESTIRDAVDLVLVGTGQFHIRVGYDLAPDARYIFADRIQVQQVLVNLLRNAMEALRTSGQTDRNITISARKSSDDMVEIAVSDSGPGIPSQVLEQLFSRFTTTKGNGGGMGIGLSISKRIVEAHGGTLSAANRPEGGASFRFTLPTVEESAE